MPLNHEQLTQSLHALQTKVNKTQEEQEQEIKLMHDYIAEILRKTEKERKSNLILGLLFIIGDLLINFLAKFFVTSRFFSTNFNPKFGIADWIVWVIGGAFLWKGLRK